MTGRNAEDRDWLVGQAHRMRSEGIGPKVIADRLGVTDRTVHRYLNDPPREHAYRRQTPRLDDALCRQFVGIEFVPYSKRDAVEAITVCGWCPIRRECAQAALDLGGTGVWAGVWIPERQGRTQAREVLRGIAEPPQRQEIAS